MRESESYNRGLIEASVDGLITVDLSVTITDVNEQMCRMSGYPREELIGTPFSDYFVDAERAIAGVNETFDKGIVKDYVLTLATQSDNKLQVSFNASVFRDSTGEVRGIFASARDITSQAQLQDQLTEERAYNRGLIEASVDGLVTVNESMSITDVNETMCRIVGRRRNQLIGASFPDFFTERERAAEGVRLTYEKGLVTNYVLTLLSADGSQIPVSFNAAIFKDSSGEVRGIFASARNITDQKELEVQLRDQQFYTRSLIESNKDALMTTDPLGIITDVNKEMEALTDYTRDELIGSLFKQYFTDSNRAEQGIRLVLKENSVTNYELTAQNKAGKETVVSYNAATFYDRDGKLQGVFAAARDVTERKRFEQTLQEKNIELESANYAKDSFLASMSHELRTPLNAIIGFTGTLLMKLPGPLTEDQDKQLKTIQTSARHLLSLINDLLDLAKIESGKLELYLAPLDCWNVVDEVSSTLRPLVETKGLQFEVIPPADEIVIRTDRRALSQILLNLSNNAVKFTEQGKICIELKQVSDNGAGFTEFRVSDTGIGIKPEDQKRLFQAFEQLTAGGSRRQEGTGLGLHLSQKLAGLLGGHIIFESEYGKGSTFTLVLPGR